MGSCSSTASWTAAYAGCDCIPLTACGRTSDPLSVVGVGSGTLRWDVKIGAVIRNGSFGDDFEGIHRRSKRPCVVKVVDPTRFRPEAILRQFKVLQRIGRHPHIVGFIGAFRTKTAVCFCTEAWGGERLIDRLQRLGPLSEEQARSGFLGFARALAYLHGLGIVHRDLKPENVLIDDADAPKMKISSFALAQFVSPGNVLVKVCGNWAYAAPEMSDPSCPGYNCRFDVFSFGVILYVALSGSHPFFNPAFDLEINKARARAAVFDFYAPSWAGVSDVARDLVRRLLQRDPTARPTSAEVVEHPWFRELGIADAPSPGGRSVDGKPRSYVGARDERVILLQQAQATEASKLEERKGAVGGASAAYDGPGAEGSAPSSKPQPMRGIRLPPLRPGAAAAVLPDTSSARSAVPSPAAWLANHSLHYTSSSLHPHDAGGVRLQYSFDGDGRLISNQGAVLQPPPVGALDVSQRPSSDSALCPPAPFMVAPPPQVLAVSSRALLAVPEVAALLYPWGHYMASSDATAEGCSPSSRGLLVPGPGTAHTASAAGGDRTHSGSWTHTQVESAQSQEGASLDPRYLYRRTFHRGGAALPQHQWARSLSTARGQHLERSPDVLRAMTVPTPAASGVGTDAPAAAAAAGVGFGPPSSWSWYPGHSAVPMAWMGYGGPGALQQPSVGCWLPPGVVDDQTPAAGSAAGQ